MRPRTVQAWLPERPPGPNEAPAHCPRPRLSHVAVISRGYPSVNSGQCWGVGGPGLSRPHDSFHLAVPGLDRRGSVAAFPAGLSWESKTQRSPALHLDCGELGGPRDAPPRELGGGGRAQSPAEGVSWPLSPGFRRGRWFPARLGFLL